MYDCIVLGLGVSGLCTIQSLAKRNLSCLGIEQFPDSKHEGSSKGPSRITRQAYFFEPENYYPLIKNSYKMWEELEKETGIPLFIKTGVVYWDSKNNGENNKKVVETCIQHGYPVEILNQKEALVKEPFFKVKEEDYYAVIEKDAGILLASNINIALQKSISEKYKKHAQLLYNTKIIKIVKTNGSNTTYDLNEEVIYTLFASDGIEYKCKNLVLAAGSWIINFFDYFKGLKEYRNFVRIESALVIHFRFKNEQLNKKLTKPFYISRPKYHIYGFPNLEDGKYIKLGIFHYYLHDEVDFEKKGIYFDQQNFDDLETIAKDYINEFGRENIEIVDYTRCNYTMTPDEHYIIDRIPLEKNAFIVNACSGHGYKFQNTIGEHVAKMVLNEEVPYETFKLSRFDKQVKAKF